ncbi:hypothetical protein HDU97_009996 [Phlyctochytrium planicorne]|nr:hypothetical protein HDU97_009996 [Phlyctochytrium planicorne]
MHNQEQSIQELAAERNAERGKKEGRGLSVPIWVVMSLLMTAAIGAIVIPLSVILVGTSNKSLNTLTTTTVQLVLKTASEGVSNFLTGTVDTMEGLTNSSYFTNDFTTNIYNIKTSGQIIPAIGKALNSHDFISAVVCTQPGQTAIGPTGPFTNRTNLQLVSTSTPAGKTTVAFYNDQTTGGFVHLAALDPINFSILKDTQINPVGVTGEGDVALKNMLSSSPSVDPYFDISFIKTSFGSFWQMSFYKNFWRTASDSGKTVPDFACSVGSLIDASITVFLNSIKVTDNTIIMLMDSNGFLLSTNRNNSISIPSTTVNGSFVRVTPDMSPNDDVSKVGKGLMGLYGSIDKIPLDGITTNTPVNQVNIAGESWFLSSSGFTVKGQKFGLVVAFPRSDMFANLDKAGTTVVIIAIVVAVIGVMFTTLSTYFALRPLQKMSQSMKQLTKFDFSSLESGSLTNRSLMTEIRGVETAFHDMVVGFAAAIRKNRALMNHSHTTSTFSKN